MPVPSENEIERRLLALGSAEDGIV